MNSKLNTVGNVTDLFAAVELFADFPKQLLEKLELATDVVQFMPDDVLLRQDEINKNLYFLLVGTLCVFVDNGKVAVLAKKGDLIGEMSVVTNRPCTATILAETPVTVVRVDTDKFKTQDGVSAEQFEAALFRIYSRILADKLTLTNEKAKRLEETTYALRRAQKELVEINQSIESRVSEKMATLEIRLGDLLKVKLLPLQSTLKGMRDAQEATVEGPISNCLDEVSGVINFLTPITESFRNELSVKGKRVLCVCAEKKDLVQAKFALGGTGVELTTVTTIEEAVNFLTQNKCDLVLADLARIEVLRMSKRMAPQASLVYLSKEAIETYLPKLRELGIMPNIAVVDPNDKTSSIRNLMAAVTKIASKNIFGVEKYLSWGADIQSEFILSSEQRSSLVENMSKYFTTLSIRSSILTNVSAVAEELLMNAIYDAPTDKLGGAKYNHLPRTSTVNLEPNERGVLKFGCDGTQIAISVEDPFGALSSVTVLKYLESCYAGRPGEHSTGKGGAGRGLHQIIEQSKFVVFNVAPKRRTEVVAVFDMVPGDREAKAPQFHFFEESS